MRNVFFVLSFVLFSMGLKAADIIPALESFDGIVYENIVIEKYEDDKLYFTHLKKNPPARVREELPVALFSPNDLNKYSQIIMAKITIKQRLILASRKAQKAIQELPIDMDKIKADFMKFKRISADKMENFSDKLSKQFDSLLDEEESNPVVSSSTTQPQYTTQTVISSSTAKIQSPTPQTIVRSSTTKTPSPTPQTIVRSSTTKTSSSTPQTVVRSSVVKPKSSTTQTTVVNSSKKVTTKYVTNKSLSKKEIQDMIKANRCYVTLRPDEPIESGTVATVTSLISGKMPINYMIVIDGVCIKNHRKWTGYLYPTGLKAKYKNEIVPIYTENMTKAVNLLTQYQEMQQAYAQEERSLLTQSFSDHEQKLNSQVQLPAESKDGDNKNTYKIIYYTGSSSKAYSWWKRAHAYNNAKKIIPQKQVTPPPKKYNNIER